MRDNSPGLKYLSMLLLLVAASTSVAGSLTAWSAFNASQQQLNIYLRSARADGSVTERQISTVGMNVTPTLQMDGSIIWLAWVDRADASRYRLRYSVLLSDSLETLETGVLETQDDYLYSPAITVSPEGTPWLTWAGFDGQDEDVRLSYYQSGAWRPQRTLTNNKVPDSLPRFEIGIDGSLEIRWEQTTALAVVSKARRVQPIGQYSILSGPPSRSMIQYKRHMSKQRPFIADKGLPLSLQNRRGVVLMGSQVELDSQ